MPIIKEGQFRPRQEQSPSNPDINTLIDQKISGLSPVVRSFFENEEMREKISAEVEKKAALAREVGAEPNMEGFVTAAVNTEKRYVVYEQYRQWMEAQGIEEGKMMEESRFYSPQKYKSKKFPNRKWQRDPFMRVEYMMENGLAVGAVVEPREMEARERAVSGGGASEAGLAGGVIEAVNVQGLIRIKGQKGLKEPFYYEVVG